MFLERVVAQMVENERSLTTQIVGEDSGSEKIPLMRSALKSMEMYHKFLSVAVPYWLEVKQARHFQSERFLKEGFPPLPHLATWVEFNGLLTFDYRVPVVNTDADIRREAIDAIDSAKAKTAYRGVLIFRQDPPFWFSNTEGLEEGESLYEAIWFEEPLPTRFKGADGKWYGTMISDYYVVSFVKSCWPKLPADDASFMNGKVGSIEVVDTDKGVRVGHHPSMGMLGIRESQAHSYRLLRMTTNLLYFLSAENQTFIRVKPEHSKGNRQGLPASDNEYRILPFQVPRYRYLLQHGTGEGTKHAYRYDVRGHFRHLRDERFQRNPDGSVRIIWIDFHQRGDSPIYKPTVRRGAVSGQILDYDRFMQSIEDRLRKHRENRSA